MGTESKRGLRRLTIGTRVFLPVHGVAEVLAIEERAFGDVPQSFYVLQLSRGDKLMLPEGNVEKVGARTLVSASKARKLLKQIAAPPLPTKGVSWKARSAGHADGLKTGDPDQYTEILHALLCRARTSKLSAGDSHALQVARGYFIAEIGAALDQPAHEIEAALAGDVAEATSSPG